MLTTDFSNLEKPDIYAYGAEKPLPYNHFFENVFLVHLVLQVLSVQVLLYIAFDGKISIWLKLYLD